MRSSGKGTSKQAQRGVNSGEFGRHFASSARNSPAKGLPAHSNQKRVREVEMKQCRKYQQQL